MWDNFVSESSILPSWGLWLVLGLALLIGVVKAKRTIPRFWARVLFVVLLTTAGILTTSMGPVVQSFFEDTVIWGTPVWGLRYVRALDFDHFITLLESLAGWGILPGALSATAAIALRGWFRKVLGSSIVASLVFITIDLVYQSRNTSSPVDIGYITNINVVGGLLAGLVIGSLGYLGERIYLHGLALPWLRDSTSRRVVLLSPVLSVFVLYLTWYFFLDHPPASVWLRMGPKWDLVDLSPYGDSLDIPNAYYTLGDEPWFSTVLRPGGSVSIDSSGSLLLASAKGSPEPQSEADPKKFAAAFRKLKPMMLQKSRESVRLEGDGDRLYLAKAGNEKLEVGIGLSTFDFIRVQHRESGGCSALFLGRPLGETKALLSLTGKYSIYLSSSYNGPQTRLFRLVGNPGGRGKVLYVEKGNDDFIQIRSDGQYLSLQTLAGSFDLPDCDRAVQWARALDYFRGEPGEGLLRVGIDSYTINSGDRVLLAKGLLESRTKDGEWVLQGSAKEVWINDVRINRSRWGRTSIELKSTFVASMIGALGASIGWFLRKRSAEEK